MFSAPLPFLEQWNSLSVREESWVRMRRGGIQNGTAEMVSGLWALCAIGFASGGTESAGENAAIAAVVAADHGTRGMAREAACPAARNDAAAQSGHVDH